MGRGAAENEHLGLWDGYSMTESEDSGFALPQAVRARTSTGAADDLVGESQLKHKPSNRGFNFPNFDVPLFTEAFCIELMAPALDVPLSLDCVPNAHPIRERFYKARRCCRARRDRRFESLTFQIEGFWLLIYPRPPGAPKLQLGMIVVREGMRYCVHRHGITRQDL